MRKFLICIFAILLSACTQKFYTLNPQSHFDFPNSNIRPIAYTSGTASEISFQPSLSGELERLAISDALNKQAGADVLINYVAEVKTTQFIILPISAITYTVTGTACAMEVGKQYLK